MGRARDVADANQQVEDEAWQCSTCSQPAQEDSAYCLSCQMYWDDDSAGALDLEDWPTSPNEQ